MKQKPCLKGKGVLLNCSDESFKQALTQRDICDLLASGDT